MESVFSGGASIGFVVAFVQYTDGSATLPHPLLPLDQFLHFPTPEGGATPLMHEMDFVAGRDGARRVQLGAGLRASVDAAYGLALTQAHKDAYASESIQAALQMGAVCSQTHCTAAADYYSNGGMSLLDVGLRRCQPAEALKVVNNTVYESDVDDPHWIVDPEEKWRHRTPDVPGT